MLIHRLMTRCRDKSCDIIKWLTSSSAQYDKWLATLAQIDISRRPLEMEVSAVAKQKQGQDFDSHLLLYAVINPAIAV